MRVRRANEGVRVALALSLVLMADRGGGTVLISACKLVTHMCRLVAVRLALSAAANISVRVSLPTPEQAALLYLSRGTII